MSLSFDFPLIIKHTQSVSAKLKISSTGEVIVSAPYFTPQSWIIGFVNQNLEWIREHLQKTHQKSKLHKKFIEGELIPFRGQLFPLNIKKDQVGRIKIGEHSGNFLAQIPPSLTIQAQSQEIRKSFLTWYKRQAKLVINPLCVKYAKLLGKTFSQIRLKDTSSRWGSCSSEGNLNFNWRLILAPPEILEYVVVHEVCHLKHPHHQQSFWQEVARFDSSYRQHRRWLKINGWKLHI